MSNSNQKQHPKATPISSKEMKEETINSQLPVADGCALEYQCITNAKIIYCSTNVPGAECKITNGYNSDTGKREEYITCGNSKVDCMTAGGGSGSGSGGELPTEPTDPDPEPVNPSGSEGETTPGTKQRGELL